jgi:pimeloyl-ACP methyl ester carboxylesterase
MFKLEQLMFWFKRPLPSDEVFEKIKCPVLLLGGTRDQTVSSSDALKAWFDLLKNGERPSTFFPRGSPPSHKADILGPWPGSRAVPPEDLRIERIVDGPHLLALLEPNRVNRFILAFLKRCEFYAVPCDTSTGRHTDDLWSNTDGLA